LGQFFKTAWASNRRVLRQGNDAWPAVSIAARTAGHEVRRRPFKISKLTAIYGYHVQEINIDAHREIEAHRLYLQIDGWLPAASIVWHVT
jgi:hypothetical protein